MNNEFRRLVHGYFDETLSAEEHEALLTSIRADANCALEFARVAFVHDRLRNELTRSHNVDVVPLASKFQTIWSRSVVALATTCAVLVIGIVLWQLEAHPAVAATELHRIIAASTQEKDHTYLISVEEVGTPDRVEKLPERNRPPKPSIDGARLYVRRPNQFVLQRKLDNGQSFVTGSNGQMSWAVRPDGPVRVSSDLLEFSRDVPGHEHAMPLSNLHEGLQQLETAYDVQVMPVEDAEQRDSDPSRLLVAVKKRGFRGPKRVEITYASSSGEIRQLRFIDMPYGPERLTIRVTLLADQPLAPEFFDHQAHHDPARTVEIEE